MTTYQKFADNILQYLQDKEIIEFLSTNEDLKGLYSEIKDSKMACVIPLVFVTNPVDFELDLNIIIKHENPDQFGQYEYYLIPNFVNKETNISELLNTLTISTNANPEEILNSIGEQVKELHFQTSADYKPFLEVNDSTTYFGLNKS